MVSMMVGLVAALAEGGVLFLLNDRTNGGVFKHLGSERCSVMFCQRELSDPGFLIWLSAYLSFIFFLFLLSKQKESNVNKDSF